MYGKALLPFLIVSMSWATVFSNHSASLSGSEWATVDEFGIGIGETGKVYLSITNSVHDPDDHMLSVTLTGPSGFSFYVAEYPTSVSDWESERQSVGTTADVVSSVAGDLIYGQITDMIIEAAMNLSGYAIPYYNVYQTLQTVNSAYEIWQTLESGIEYDIVTYVFESSASGLYEFTIHNPSFHPYSNNTLTVMILPKVNQEVTERFTSNGSIITDHVTGLEWIVGPDVPTSWHEAQEWIDNLGGEWRFPSRDELSELYNDAGVYDENSSFFHMTGRMVWSGEQMYSDRYEEVVAWGFGFTENNAAGYPCDVWGLLDGRSDFWQSERAFAVR